MEGLTASVVLVILVVGVVGSLSTSYQQSQSVRANSTAVTLARQLVDEIVSKPFDGDAAGTGAGARSTFTDVTLTTAIPIPAPQCPCWGAERWT